MKFTSYTKFSNIADHVGPVSVPVEVVLGEAKPPEALAAVVVWMGQRTTRSWFVSTYHDVMSLSYQAFGVRRDVKEDRWYFVEAARCWGVALMSGESGIIKCNRQNSPINNQRWHV